MTNRWNTNSSKASGLAYYRLRFNDARAKVLSCKYASDKSPILHRHNQKQSTPNNISTALKVSNLTFCLLLFRRNCYSKLVLGDLRPILYFQRTHMELPSSRWKGSFMTIELLSPPFTRLLHIHLSQLWFGNSSLTLVYNLRLLEELSQLIQIELF